MKQLGHFLSRTWRVMFLTGLAYAPVAYAQTGSTCKNAADLGTFMQLCVIGFIDQFVVPVIFALAFIVFLWGVYNYFVAGGANEEKRQEGQKFVLWAIIGFVLMFSLWGIINLLKNSLPLNGTRPDYPHFEGVSQPGSSNTGTNSFTSPSGTASQCNNSLDCGGSACINGKCDYSGTAVENECNSALDCGGSACINGKCDAGNGNGTVPVTPADGPIIGH